MAIWRYNEDGTLDTTFNGTGFVVYTDASGTIGYHEGKDITIDSNGKIVVSGLGNNTTTDTDMMLWRYNQDGTLDNTFNGSGFITSGINGNDFGGDIKIDDNGKILVSISPNMSIWRLNGDGTMDYTFNDDGIYVPTGLRPFDGTSLALDIDLDGKILVAGHNADSNNTDMAIWRILP